MTMAAKGQSYAEKFSRWELLVTNSKLDAQQRPHLAEDLASLESLLMQVRSIESRQEDLRSQARALNADLRKVAAQGEKLRSRLGASMQGLLGFDSDELLKFGFKPRKPPVRKRKPAPEPEDPAPGTTPPTTR
jgi:hypothetical protein